tara:strand:+ start:859 stop:1422 length:564 start_codon:yes stop_codon:yes gene_type:complete
MALGNRVKTDALNTTYTTEQYALGTKFVESAEEVAANGSGVNTSVTLTAAQKLMLAGERTWVFIKSSGTIAAGDLVKRTADTDAYTGVQDDSDEGAKYDMLGVADHAIASGEYGWIICKGACVVQAESGVAAGHLLASDGNNTAGEVDTWTSGAGTSHKCIGIALEAEDSGSTFGAGYVIARIDIPA